MSAAGATKSPMFLVVSLVLTFAWALGFAWAAAEFLTCGNTLLRNWVLLILGVISAGAWFVSASISLGLSRGTIPPRLSFAGNVANLVAALTTGMCVLIQNVPLSGVCS